jgi:enoyl-CoA hydratase/carnithine racemase
MNEVLLIETHGPVAVLTINRPEIRNPLGHDGDGDAFAAAAARINGDRSIRAVILTGAGKAFSAGGDVKAMREKGGAFAGPGVSIRERYRTGIHRIVRSVWGIEVPVIAAVNGPAIGLGNDVACLADTRIASDLWCDVFEDWTDPWRWRRLAVAARHWHGPRLRAALHR